MRIHNFLKKYKRHKMLYTDCSPDMNYILALKYIEGQGSIRMFLCKQRNYMHIATALAWDDQLDHQ
jgi:hypothetical protein